VAPRQLQKIFIYSCHNFSRSFPLVFSLSPVNIFFLKLSLTSVAKIQENADKTVLLAESAPQGGLFPCKSARICRKR
ncbi:MAG: hypothetical protein K2N94_15575, partial [Lachnospiraceae bacterium]|nr:hypothetical protein [Lachnospiraceae bacterium]